MITLSDKRDDAWQGRGVICYKESDVKQFIKELKEFPKKSKFGPFNPVFIELEEFIDELAGEALI